MKNLKKLVSVIVTVAMLVSAFAAIGVSANGEYGDVAANNSYYKAIKVLSGLGVVKGDDEGNFNPTNDIKRSEMVTLVCRALGEESVALASAGSSFDDVAANHWAAGYIAWGVSRKIVNGVGDNKFDPDAPVKFQDAVVMVLRALGYDKVANRAENGGYPTGYMKVASQKGVLAGANFDGAKAATREVVAQVIYNALTTPLIELKSYVNNPEDEEYVVYDGDGTSLGGARKTLLVDNAGVYKVKADVLATAKTSAALRKDPANPKVKLDITDAYEYADSAIIAKLGGYVANGTEITPFVGETEISDYIGYTVEAYVTEDKAIDDLVLLAVVVDTKSVDTVTVEEGFANYVSGTFEYYENEDDAKTTKLDIATTPAIYYNGMAISQSEIEAMVTPATGVAAIKALLVNEANSITFMGPRNSAFDKIFVTDYQYKQVKSVKADREFIKYDGGSLSLNKEDRNDETFVYNVFDAEGNVIGLEDIKEDDILNIVAPIGSLATVPYMDIYVTDATVTGSVTEKLSATKYVIAGETYETLTAIKEGDEGTFFLTIDGLVFKADASSVVNKNYSFIVAHGSDTSFSVTTHQLKLFTGEGLETFDVASTLRVYDVMGSPAAYTYATYKTTDGTQDAFFATLAGYLDPIAAGSEDTAGYNAAKAAVEAEFVERIVTYKLNNAGEIMELRFANTDPVADFKVANNAAAKYNDDLQVFGGKDLDADSKLFIAPVTGVLVSGVTNFSVDEDDLAMGTFASIDEDDSYNTYLFDFAGDDYLGAAIVGKEIDSSLKASHMAIVKSTSTGLDADGSSVVKYTFVQSGEIITKTVDYDATVAAMTIGDVFRYTVNAEDEINKTEIIVDVDAAGVATFNDLYAYASLDTNDMAIVYGTVTKVEDNKLTVGSLTAKMNDTEGNTYAQFDKAKFVTNVKNPGSAVTVLDGYDYINESYTGHTYSVVAFVNEAGRFEDIIQFYVAA